MSSGQHLEACHLEAKLGRRISSMSPTSMPSRGFLATEKKTRHPGVLRQPMTGSWTNFHVKENESTSYWTPDNGHYT